MKLLTAIFSFAFSVSLFAADCSVDTKSIDVSWKAFKTPIKAGVGGSFKGLTYTGKKSATSMDDIIKSAAMTIETGSDSVHTKDKSRDGKIAKFFFSTMSGGTQIKAQVKSYTKKALTLSVTMNGKTVDVPMSYKVEGKNLSAQGVIDVFDFGMTKQLEGINKACKALHEGKTWNDVEISLKASFKGC
ncbi:MAG: YceI family protein [Deltaproteobacteria bacterium]|nr:MAG: YceI family protein [Deltaproteobacteria bacterium]